MADTATPARGPGGGPEGLVRPRPAAPGHLYSTGPIAGIPSCLASSP